VDEVADHAEAGLARGHDVAAAVGDRGGGVVDPERPPLGEALLEQRGLAGARAELVHRDEHVAVTPALAVERALPGSLEPAQHDRLHAADATAPVRCMHTAVMGRAGPWPSRTASSARPMHPHSSSSMAWAPPARRWTAWRRCWRRASA